MQGIFQKENTDKALKYGIYRHLPTYEKIIRNLVSFYTKKKGESIIMTHREIGIYEINRISYLGKGYMYWVDTCLFLYIE